MAQSDQETLPTASSTPSANADLDEAQTNLEHCLTGLDQNGEAGLQNALNRIYRSTGLVRNPLGGILSDSYAQFYYPPNTK